MAKKQVEVPVEDFSIDSEELAIQQQEIPAEQPFVQSTGKVKKAVTQRSHDGLINCLQNRKVTVKFIPMPGTINDPKHVLYGGMAERSVLTVTVPKLRSGTFKNVLTDSEKAYLEYAMGLEDGALNVYNKVNNFWDNTTEGGVSRVRLTKYDTTLDLSDPIDYIKYKILLANKDIIAPDLQTYQDRPKATYRFVLIAENEVSSAAKSKMTVKMQCYVEYGKIENDWDTLKTVIEIITSKPVSANTSLEFLQTTAGELIEADAKVFLSVVKDPLLSAKILIKKCVEQGFISKRGDFYYLRSDNSPLCEGGEDPILTNAAKYITNPKRQEMKLSLEAKLKIK